MRVCVSLESGVARLHLHCISAQVGTHRCGDHAHASRKHGLRGNDAIRVVPIPGRGGPMKRLVMMLLILASPALAESPKPAIVLVHGAFADASGWSRVIPILERDGYFVTAVQIPLTSLSDDVAT